MATNIDREVVEMKFDNTDFEKNAATSLSTLDKLKNAIKFENLAHPFSKITESLKGVSFDPMVQGIETVQARFSMLDVAVATIVQNITNSVLGMARKITNDFVIAPVTTGFQEYETQINAVQTILSNTKSKGTTIDDVNKALDELNLYADKTIYNFTQMTDNIGRFTAAGLDLDTSVSAIQGIANLAAMSGSTSQQASTAMYQLSQALSSGTVKLQDWNSVVNAGMGGELFQEQLKMTSREMVGISEKMQGMYKELDPMGNKFEDTAKIIADKFNISLKDTEDILKNGYGFNVDEIIENAGSYRESLKEGWITSTVLAKTLDRLTTSGAIAYIGEHLQENSKYTLENVEAMYKEAMAAKDADAEIKKLAKTIAESTDLTEEQIDSVLNMAMTAEDAATKVKTFTQLVDTLKEAAQSGWTQSWEIIIGDFEEARELFTMISDRLGAVISKSADARNSMLQAWADAGGRQMLIDSLFNLFDAISNFVAPIKDVFDTLFPPMTAEKLLAITEGFKAFTESLILNEEAQNKLRETLTKLVEPFSWIAKIVGGIISKSAELGVFRDIWESIKNVAITLINVFSAIATAIANVFFNKDLDNMEGSIQRIAEIIKLITGKIREITEKIKLTSEETGKLSAIFESVLRIARLAKDIFFEIVGRIASFITSHMDAISTIKEKILEIGSAAAEWINQHVRAKEILDGIKHLFESIGDIASKAYDKIKGFIDLIKEKLSNLFSKKEGEEDTGFFSGVLNTLKKIGSFIKEGLLPAFKGLFNQLKQLDWGKIFAGLVAIFNWDNINKIIDFIFGEKNPSGIISNLSEGFFKPLKEALGGFGDVLSEFKNSIKTNELIKIAIGIGILSASLVALSKIDQEGLANGLSGITTLFTELIAAAKILGSGKNIDVDGLLEIAVSVGILALSMKSLGKLDKEQIDQASSAIISLMTALTVVSKLLSSGDSKSIMEGMGGLIAFSVAILILSMAVKKLAKLDPGAMELATGAIMLLILTFAAISKNLGQADLTSISESATGMLLFAVAILVLAEAVKMLAKMKMEDMIKGLAGVGALLLEMSLFLKTSNVGDIAGSAGGMILFAAGIVILAVAVKMLSSLDLELLARGLIGVGGILLAVGIFANMVKSAKLPVIGAGLLLIATAFVIIAAAMKIMSTINMDQVISGLIGFGGVLLSLAIFTKLVNGANLAAIGAGLLIVSVALVVIASALKILSTIDGESMAVSLAAVAAMLTMLAIAVNAMKGTLAGSASLLIAAVALGALVPPLVILGSLSWTTIVKGLIALAGGLAILITAAILGQAVSVGLLALSAAMLALGASVLMIGAGLTLIGVGLTTISAGLLAFTINFVATLGVILASIPALVKGILLFIKETIKGLADIITELIPAIKNIVVALITAVCETVIETAPTIVQTIVTLIGLLLAALTNIIPDLITFIGDLITNLLDGLSTHIGEWVAKLIDIGINIIDGLADGLAEAGPRLREALGHLVEGLIEFVKGLFGIHSPSTVFADIGINLIEGLINGIWSMFTGIITGLADFIGGIIDAVLGWIVDFFDAGVEFISNLLEGIWSKAQEVWDACKEIGEKAIEFLKGAVTGPANAVGKALTENFKDGIEGEEGQAKEAGEKIKDAAKGGLDSGQDQFQKSGTALGSKATSGVESQTGAMNSAGRKIASAGQSGVSSTSGSYSSAGSSLGSAAASGIGSKTQAFASEARRVATIGEQAARSTRSSYEATGAYLTDGLTSGFGSRVHAFIDKVRQTANQANTEARNTLGVHSPSTVFAEIGRYTMEGFIVGMESYRDRVGNTAAEIGDDTIDAMNGAIGAIATIAEDDIDSYPVITPVLDLSNVESEAGRIPGLLNTMDTYRLASQNGSLIDISEASKQGTANTMAEEIVRLRNDFNTLVDAINGLQIVMDSGVVAGELAAPLDKALGARNIHVGRGAY